MAANTAQANLAAQIRAENPQLSLQQATLVAARLIAGAQITTANAATSGLPQSVLNAAAMPGFAAGLPFFEPAAPGFLPTVPGFAPTIPGDSGGDVSLGGPPQTAEGAALQGTAQVIAATGQKNLATSTAALNATQAQSAAMRNAVQSVSTFYQVREAGRLERDKERGTRPTPEQHASRAYLRRPRSLDGSQVDLVTGAVHWPMPLQSAEFSEQRKAVGDSRPDGFDTAPWTPTT